MPFDSEAQRRAMYAAAAGKSNIGIPKSVGKKFVAHDSSVPNPSTCPLSGYLDSVRRGDSDGTLKLGKLK